MSDVLKIGNAHFTNDAHSHFWGNLGLGVKGLGEKKSRK